MGCDDVRRIAYFFLDGQLGERKLEDLTLHLQACRSCDDRVVFHRRIRIFLQKRLNAQPAPDALHTRIRSAVSAEKARIPIDGGAAI